MRIVVKLLRVDIFPPAGLVRQVVVQCGVPAASSLFADYELVEGCDRFGTAFWLC